LHTHPFTGQEKRGERNDWKNHGSSGKEQEPHIIKFNQAKNSYLKGEGKTDEIERSHSTRRRNETEKDGLIWSRKTGFGRDVPWWVEASFVLGF